MTHLNNDQQVEFQTEATRFFELLGKDPDKTWIRCLRQWKAKTGTGADTQHLEVKPDANAYFITGNGDPANGFAVNDSDIKNCPALFVEWDNKPIEWQLTAWKELCLPEPTVSVSSGGKSIHLYWVLNEPMEPEPWRKLITRLIDHCGADANNKNLSRPMRLPGGFYYDKKTGEQVGQCKILKTFDRRYYPADIEDCLSNITVEADDNNCLAAPSKEWEPRSVDEITAAAAFIPPRIVGGGTYEQSRNALCGCSAAFAEAGVIDPDDAALKLLGHLWADAPPGAAWQVLDTCSTRNAASFWAIASSQGFRMKPGKIKSKNHPLPNTFIGLIKDLDDGWSPKGAISGLSPGHLKDLLPSNLLSFNEMDLRTYVNTVNGRKIITESDLDSAFVVLSSKGWRIGIDPLTKAVLHVARQQTFHPLREYLENVRN